MPRNRFIENEDGQFESADEELEELLEKIERGTISVSEARKILGLPELRRTVTQDLLNNLEEFTEGEDRPLQEIPVENLGGLFEEPEKVEETLQNLRGNEGFTTTAQHLERLREPTRWERG